MHNNDRSFSSYVAEEIRGEMGKASMSGKVLATHIGVSQNYLAKRLRGENEFTVSDVAKIAQALDLNLLDLFEEAERSQERSKKRGKTAKRLGPNI